MGEGTEGGDDKVIEMMRYKREEVGRKEEKGEGH